MDIYCIWCNTEKVVNKKLICKECEDEAMQIPEFVIGPDEYENENEKYLIID